MLAHDRLEADRAVARNAVEEYVYDMRDKLEDQLQEYISQEVRVGVTGAVRWTLLHSGTVITEGPPTNMSCSFVHCVSVRLLCASLCDRIRSHL